MTFSGLLNALDGLAAGEDRIAFLTTNHRGRLDEALIRPGRVDYEVLLGEATRYQAGRMWERYYGDVDAHDAGRALFLDRLDELGLFGTGGHISTAEIQGLFQKHKGNMDGAIGGLHDLVPRTFTKLGGTSSPPSTSSAEKVDEDPGTFAAKVYDESGTPSTPA